MPKVSVVIPTCNRADFLKAAIESVLKQTFQDFEIIVVDDASRDQTAEVMAGFQDPRIHYIRHETNKGQGRTRNAGIEQASGEYVALLDDDDEWLPEKLEKQVSLLDSSADAVGLVYTGFYRVEGASKRVISRFIPEDRGYVYDRLRVKNSIGTCSTVLLRRLCLERVGGFDETLTCGADYDMWVRISKDSFFEYLDEPLVRYAVHSERISTNYNSLIKGKETLLKKYAQYYAADPKNHSRRYRNLGIAYCLSGNTKKGRSAVLTAIRLYPFELRNYYHLILSFLGASRYRVLRQNRLALQRTVGEELTV